VVITIDLLSDQVTTASEALTDEFILSYDGDELHEFYEQDLAP